MWKLRGNNSIGWLSGCCTSQITETIDSESEIHRKPWFSALFSFTLIDLIDVGSEELGVFGFGDSICWPCCPPTSAKPLKLLKFEGFCFGFVWEIRTFGNIQRSIHIILPWMLLSSLVHLLKKEFHSISKTMSHRIVYKEML